MSQTTDRPTELAIDQLEPSDDNLRRKAKDGPRFKELVASVRTLGIIEPLVVRPNGGKYKIVAGERRYEAAKTVGLATVPVHVRDLTDAEATQVMLIENLQREDLTPVEEATGYMRLVGLGMTQKQLAKEIGRTQSHVSDRLKLLELPPSVQKKIDAGELPIGAAEHLLKLGDRKEIEAFMKDRPLYGWGNRPEDFERSVRVTLENRKRAERVEKARALAEKAGVPFLEVEGYSLPGNTKTKEIGDGYYALKLDVKAHRTEPCHAFVLLTGNQDVITVCTDPKRHAAKGESELKLPKEETPKRASGGTDAAYKKQQAEKRAKTKARREGAAELLGGKLPSDAAQMALRTMVLEASDSRRRAVCELLGIEIPKPKNPNAFGAKAAEADKALAKYMDGPTKVVRAAAAMAVVLVDDLYESHPAVKHVTAWLKSQGVK